MKALDYPKESHVVADELEAFLHVLVKMCIRYMPHDCADPAALHEAYYNTEEDGTGKECSTLKRNCITEGLLQTPEGAPVTFLLPKKGRTGAGAGPRCAGSEVPFEHPLESIISPLFYAAGVRTRVLEDARDRQWRAAKEKQHAERLEATDASKENRDKYTPPTLKPRPPCLERPPLRNANLNCLDEEHSEEGLDFEDLDTDKVPYMRMLKTHGPILTLLSSVLRRTDWPQRDKTQDQLSGDGDEDGDASYDPEGSDSDASFFGHTTSIAEENNANDVSEQHYDAEVSGERTLEEDYTESSPQTTGDAPQEEVAPGRGRPGKRARSDSSWNSDVSSSDVALAKRLRGL